MSAKKKREIEFQYYEIPHGERFLSLSGKVAPKEEGSDPSCEKQHFHNLLEIAYCVDGEGEIFFGRERFLYRRGTVAIIPQNISYSIGSHNAESHWEYLFLNPNELLRESYPDSPLFVKRLLEAVNRREQCYTAEENDRFVTLVKIVVEECRNRGAFFGEYTRGLLLSILLSIARGNMESADGTDESVHHSGIGQISAAIDYINKNYMENIKTEALAYACNLSETHFRRLFAEYMNMSPLEYINLIRIQQACDIMKKTSCSMEEVAGRVGYPAISTFNRNFRKIMGTSPYRYKKNGQGYHG